MNQQKWPSLFMNILEYRISTNRIDLLAKKEKQIMINYHYPRITNIRHECSILVFQMVPQKKNMTTFRKLLFSIEIQANLTTVISFKLLLNLSFIFVVHVLK